MIKKFILYLLRDSVTAIVNEEIDKRLYVKPATINKIKVASIKKGKKPTVWDILEIENASISFCVRYLDDYNVEDFESYRVSGLAELKHLLVKFKPKRNAFSSVSLHVTPPGSTTSVIETLSPNGDKVYDVNQLPAIIDPIIDWINERPEFLL